MRKFYGFALLLVLSASVTQCFAACHAVGPSAAGNGSGSDWNNRMNKLPATLQRGDTYYLMDGSYGSYSMNTSNSGTTPITVKKAQSYDFGRASDGCSSDISAGWNSGTMGSGQATFTNFGNNCATCGYFTLDGNGQSSGIGCGAAPSLSAGANDCGFKFTVNSGSSGPLDIGVNAGGANRTPNWTIRYLEIAGPGDFATDQNFIWCHGGCDNLLIEHAYWYNSACVFIKLPWTNSTTVRSSYFKQNYSTSTCHGQMYLSEVNTSNVDFHNDVFQDIQGTGLFVIVTGGRASNYKIYNNVVFRTSGSSRSGFSNGIWACINGGSTCTNISFIQNDVVNYAVDYSGALGILDENGGGSYTWENNLFYSNPSSSVGFTLNGSTFTHDHNSWLNSGSPSSGAGDVTITSGAPNPFVNWAGANFALGSENANWESGATLAQPFNVDMANSARPGTDGVWDRGAMQYAGSQAQAPAPPTALTALVQ